jgi:two-component system sensor histidine kinase KdpD
MDNIEKNRQSENRSKPSLYLVRVLVICVCSTALSILMNKLGIGKENTLMVFLVGVLAVTAVTEGYVYGALASVFSVMLFNFFFTEPYNTLIINDSGDFILIVFFLIASIISATMTSKLRYQTIAAKHNERTAKLLYEITKGFLNVTGKENIVNKAITYVHDYAGYKCYVKLDSEDKVFCFDGLPDYEITDKQGICIIPIKGLANQIGTLDIIDVRRAIPPEEDMIIKTIVYQMAIVLDREFIYNEREKIKISMESEHLKSTLLRSISHDLRTPLTGIIGASDLILESHDNLDPKSIKKLVCDINEESKWLIKTVQNILDMTRISEGNLTLNKDYEAVDDIISQAVAHMPQFTSTGRLHVSVPDDIMLIFADGKLLVQVLINLLDNAYKHSGEGTDVYLKAYKEDSNLIFEVEDNGIGFDPEMMDSIFDGFVTKTRGIADGGLDMGLGLSICKAIVDAHGGTISAKNKNTEGAVFKVTLPMEEK